MATTSEPQKQLLNLIRDFATEKSQGERKLVGLRKRIEDLRAELDDANGKLEGVKCLKETTEQELKGYEVELSLNLASIQTLEARISQIQDEISVIGGSIEALKNDEGALRDEFICEMSGFNSKIRNFQEKVASAFHQKDSNESSSVSEPGDNHVNQDDAQAALKALENELASVISQTNVEQKEYEAELIKYKQVKQETVDFERKLSLLKAIMEEKKELQDLTKKSLVLEEASSVAAEELQRRSVCPSCHLENVDALGELLQANEDQ